MELFIVRGSYWVEIYMNVSELERLNKLFKYSFEHIKKNKETVYVGCVELIVSMFPCFRACSFSNVQNKKNKKNDGLGARYIELLFL